MMIKFEQKVIHVDDITNDSTVADLLEGIKKKFSLSESELDQISLEC